MGREVPFDSTKKCDECGKIGAYDFMGDCYCDGCITKFEADTDDADAEVKEIFGRTMGGG